MCSNIYVIVFFLRADHKDKRVSIAGNNPCRKCNMVLGLNTSELVICLYWWTAGTAAGAGLSPYTLFYKNTFMLDPPN